MLVLRGPLWDTYVIVTLALAGGVARTVYTDPLIRRAGDEGLRRDARGASAQLARRDGPPSAREVGVFIPGHVSSCEPLAGCRSRWLGRGTRGLPRRAAENARAVRDDGQRSGETRATRRHCVGLGSLCRSGSTSTGWCCAGGFSHRSRIGFCSGHREGAAMALVWTPMETMFFGVLGIVRCTIMLSQ